MLKEAACLLCMLASHQAVRYLETGSLAGDTFKQKAPADPMEDLPADPRRDVFSVLNVNTFLMEVRIGAKRMFGGGYALDEKPNMEDRAAGFVKWFMTLEKKDVPDVVLFNEILSKTASSMFRRLCNPYWKAAQRLWSMPCVPESPFAEATRVLMHSGIFLSGGVVICVRKGLWMSDFAEEAYEAHDVLDGLAQKGFLRVKVQKHNIGNVWVFGTHMQAWPDNSDIRVDQFKQMWQHISRNIPKGEKVVIAGDFNTETREVEDMKRELHADNPPVSEAGFFMPLRTPLKYSTYGSGGQNAFIHHDKKEFHDMSPHDQILYVSSEGYVRPESMVWQYLPMKSETCYEAKRGLASYVHSMQIDELSDHYAAYGELCYGSNCALNELSGHHGYTGIHRDDEFRCCPGRGAIEGRCYDWAAGGIKYGRIGFAVGKPKNGKNGTYTEVGYCTKSEKGYTCPIVDGNEVLRANSLEECEAKLVLVDLPFKFILRNCVLESTKYSKT